MSVIADPEDVPMDVETPAKTTAQPSLDAPRVDAAPTPADARTCYRTEGYAIRPGVVPHELIDRFVESLRRDIFPSREKFYRQNTARYETNRFTKYGHLDNALIDLHDFRRHRAFSLRGLDLFFCEPLLSEMERLTGQPRMQLVRTMLIDANPKTPPHQDWWYPDAVPSGNLIGAWIALEDIDERAGRFYVVRDSRSVKLHEELERLTHRGRLARIAAWETEHQDRLVAPAMNKGDVVFWNSSTIHGSLPTQDGRFSRKSVSAHYIPEDATLDNLFSRTDLIRMKEYKGMKFCENQSEYSRLRKVRSAVRKRASEHPSLLRGLRKIQATLPGDH